MLRRYRQQPMARVALRARLQRPYRRRQFLAFGSDSVLDRPEWLYGTQRISIGDRVIVLRGAWLSAERPTWGRTEPAISIGDGAAIRTHVVISATSGVVIEENVLVASFVSLVDSDHTITETDGNPLWNPVESAPIRVGAGSWLGERVTVLGGSAIGRRCIIGAHSVVRGQIPDESIAVGAPARVVGSTATT